MKSSETKKAITIKLKESSINQIKQLAAKHHVSQSDLIAVLVHCFYMGWDEEKLEEGLELAAKL